MSDKYAVPNKLPAKQVNVMTHRKRRLREEESHHRVKRLNRSFKLRSKKRDYKKPEFFITQYLKAERDSKRMRRVIMKNNFLKGVDDEEPKLLVVMHHRAHRVASKECTLIMNSMGLNRLHNTVLLKNTTESLALLKMIEPYVVYGYPTIQTVRDLIFKHGFLRIKGKRTAINSNKLIEEHLGEHGCICIEDIVHDLFTVSDNFKNVRSLLLPFSLKAPRDGWSKKIGVSYSRGGEYGNRKHEINALIERCL
ncbi:60S ribosomal protein L7-4 [Contarinia nasturtii]|uniref:60S ribosomal protein L7-4 n=1 Tax=Contarinia nasturtii TaxID=265458 RepID=UPI0012D484B5|nr:60S ribosomal protein L7-4 [Contarinia nasturtii]